MAANLFPAEMSLGPFYVLGVLFVVSSLFSTASNNAAAAVILAPVAYAAAEASGIDVSKTFLAVAYGASCAFVLPFAQLGAGKNSSLRGAGRKSLEPGAGFDARGF